MATSGKLTKAEDGLSPSASSAMPDVVDQVALARLYGEPLFAMPTDLYYSGLDRDWNANSNTVYGEVTDNPDMAWEVIVGRIPVRTAAQATDYINKLISFETAPPTNLSKKIILGGIKLSTKLASFIAARMAISWVVIRGKPFGQFTLKHKQCKVAVSDSTRIKSCPRFHVMEPLPFLVFCSQRLSHFRLARP